MRYSCAAVTKVKSQCRFVILPKLISFFCHHFCRVNYFICMLFSQNYNFYTALYLMLKIHKSITSSIVDLPCKPYCPTNAHASRIARRLMYELPKNSNCTFTSYDSLSRLQQAQTVTKATRMSEY